MRKIRKSKLLSALIFSAISIFGALIIGSAFIAYQLYLQHQHAQQAKQYLGLPDYLALHRFDPERRGGHLLPNLDLLVVGPRAHTPVRFVTNSDGFRATREFSEVPHPGTLRILLIGDSYVDGMRTDQELTIGAQLEKIISLPIGNYTSVEVMISGNNNPTNAWYFFQEHGHKFAPQIVVLGVTLGNDLTWYNLGAHFILDDEQNSLQIKTPARQTGSELPNLLLPDEAYTEKSILDDIYVLEQRIRIFLASRLDIFEDWVAPVTGPSVCKPRHVYAGGFFNSLGLFYQPPQAEIEQMYKDFERTIVGMNQQVQAIGAKFIVTLFPTRKQIYPHEWNLLARQYALKQSKFDLSYPDRRIEKVCRDKAIACLLLAPAFRAAKRQLYLPKGDMHFNEHGQLLAATEISRKIEGTSLN